MCPPLAGFFTRASSGLRNGQSAYFGPHVERGPHCANAERAHRKAVNYECSLPLLRKEIL
jgi:hypothetical protein